MIFAMSRIERTAMYASSPHRATKRDSFTSANLPRNTSPQRVAPRGSSHAPLRVRRRHVNRSSAASVAAP